MSEKKICLFAGTTEGRELAFFLAGKCALTVCVATEYGEILLEGLKGADIRAGRLAEAAMEVLFEEEAFELVADASILMRRRSPPISSARQVPAAANISGFRARSAERFPAVYMYPLPRRPRIILRINPGMSLSRPA